MRRLASYAALAAACGALTVSATRYFAEQNTVALDVEMGQASQIVLSQRTTALANGVEAPLSFAPVFGTKNAIREVQSLDKPAPARQLDYRLSGVLFASETGWAVLEGEGESLVLREGDSFGQGLSVARIAANEVVLVGQDGDWSLTLEGTRAGVRDLAQRKTHTAVTLVGEKASQEPYVGMVRSVVMSRDEVNALVALAQLR